MRLHLKMVCGAALVAAAAPFSPAGLAAAPRPNIVHIFADDLGWGSVGFNGQVEIATPRLDALAQGGMVLANSYAAPVCAPSRAMLYTGFHQGHAVIDGNDALSADEGFRAEDVMTGQVMKSAGYTTGVFGKWGFGSTEGSVNTQPTVDAPDSLPNHHGYDEFYGYLNHGAAHDYFYKWMWQTDPNGNEGVSIAVNNGGYTHDLIAARSEQFVANHAGEAEPFYLQVNYTIPHEDLADIASAPGGYGIYAGKAWTSDQKAYAAMITRMDTSVGSLLDKLNDPNGDHNPDDSVLNNTLVLFTSDNGGDKGTFADPHPDVVNFFHGNGQFRGGKFESFEGGIHVPGVASWPGTIAPGSESEYRTDVADFMATAADLAGAETPVGIDGVSIAPSLTGEGRQRQRDYLIFEHQGSRGTAGNVAQRMAIVRQDGMKLIRYADETQELYNLNANPTETAPLSLGIPANAQIAAELQAALIAEGALRGVVQYRSYTGANGGNVQDDSSWDGVGRPNGYWSATIRNTGASPRIAHVSADVTTLGVEVRGQTALQAVDVHLGATLTGRNEVRIGALGRVDLSGGTLATNRWVNVRAGGELRGHGTVIGDVYNEGVASPGRPAGDPAWPTAAPPALPPITLDTGVGTAATFNFTGVQDDVPLLATSALSPYVELTKGLDFGPGVQPKLGNAGTDAGNEFNIMGQGAGTLGDAIINGDYISFTVDPIAGAGLIPSTVSFRLWRHATNSAKNYAILSSIGGFTAGAALTPQGSYNDTGSSAQHTLSVTLPAIEAVTVPIEYRLYGWGATAGGGNTHINLASLVGRFVAVPTLEFNFATVQDVAPLIALKRQDASLALKAGLSFGHGVEPRGANNVGNEFHVAGFSTGTTLQSAIDGGDYLSFAVQPITGMAMYPDSVSFTLWRQAGESAADYAVMSSVGGFTAGQQLAQAHHTTVGSSNQLTLTGSFAGAAPTTDQVEFRLYGWNAATSLDSTHVVGASMRARFASVVGSPIDPIGALAVQGDFYHLEGGILDIDLGGAGAGNFDSVNVTGTVELEGDLNVSLVDAGGGTPFAPSFGNTFKILSATGGLTGEFGDVDLPPIAAGLDWFVDYSATDVTLDVMAGADFDRSGGVDADDLALWKAGEGMAAGATKLDGDANNDGAVDGSDFMLWQRQFGLSANFAVESAQAVPEPTGCILWLGLSGVAGWAAKNRAAGRRLGRAR